MYQKLSGIEKFYASGRGVSRFFVENVLSHSTEKIRWGTLRCIRNFRVSKSFMHQGGVIKFLRRKRFVSQYRKNRWGTLRCFRKFRVSQNFMHKMGILLISVEKSLSHSTDIIRRGTLLCFDRILVSKFFKQRRGEASRFCRKIFYLTGPKEIRLGTIPSFRKFLVEKNILWIRGGGGGYHDFPSESFCLTLPENFVGIPSMFQKIWGIENIYAY